MTTNPRCRFSIDRGGTFTDVFVSYMQSDGKWVSDSCKLLSVDPGNYADAPTEGIRRMVEKITGRKIPSNTRIPTEDIESIRMGTTVATNALLERRGEAVCLLVTKGFADVLEIGNQSRPNIFDLEISRPDILYKHVVEVDARVRLVPDQHNNNNNSGNVRVGKTGELIEVLKELDEPTITAELQRIYGLGIRSLAIVLMHSYLFPDHEQRIGELAKHVGFDHISLSSALVAMPRIVPRGLTCCVDAYLTPILKRYMQTFYAGFDDGITSRVKVLFMQSDGGLTPASQFTGYKAILSGPAGGVVGYSKVTYDPAAKEPLIGFDMGGTSTDVSRYAGSFDLIYDTEVAGVQIQAPQLDITTVAAGGGSRLFFEAGMFIVGPESASANPGPVCYRRKGGLLAVTDANLFLGRLPLDLFPHIFGENKDQPLDLVATQHAFSDISRRVNDFFAQHQLDEPHKPLSEDEVAFGFVQVANEAMCRPIRAVTQARGFDTRKHVLACFGGAGGQHACAIARSLGMRKIAISRYAGVLSALGLAMADVTAERQAPVQKTLSDTAFAGISATLDELAQQASADLVAQGFQASEITIERFLLIRFHGTDVATIVREPADGSHDYRKAFLTQYHQEFGFTLPGRDLIVDVARVRGIGHSPRINVPAITAHALPAPKSVQSCYFGGANPGRQQTPVYLWDEIGAGLRIQGPAIIISGNSTALVEPGCHAELDEQGTIHITVEEQEAATTSTKLDAVMLSLFSHRFMSIAEQMGRTLQRTAVSTNIKERLDFSCALFTPDGGLVANAPHIPVHLGAMGEAVKWQLKIHGNTLEPGDVLVSNHPAFGGSHLPDITVITPYFTKDKQLVFLVASRGHHADIGGITPGSMPPFSTSLDEEGACIKSFKLVKHDVFQEEGITDILCNFPKDIKRRPDQIPVVGTRNLPDNLNDLKAQVAANQRGIFLIEELVAETSLQVVTAYMKHVQYAAELAVRHMLVQTSLSHGLPEIGTLHAEDKMDDGTPVVVRVTIDRRSGGSAEIDFSGTGPEVFGNWNAPEAVTYSAVIYSMRCLVSRDIPLNSGCLTPIKIVIPPGSILSPSVEAAVVGGNVLTSQRVTDVILAAFGAAAASQGCMNNLTFGNEKMGYYETICGGSGAGPHWHGKSAVHTHMTNTRITDAEILEKRYPVLVREFSIRRNSGGLGLFHGGNGAVRELEFLAPLQLSILSERRVVPPPGLFGGKSGACGLNLLIARDGRTRNLGGKNSILVNQGDRVRIMTPGGGAFGAEKHQNQS